jgi:drug/metabolite transporter (DMT)-like permease
MSRGLVTFLLTLLTLMAFAANSVLTRLALIDAEIGPWSFVTIRILSGALMLILIVSVRHSFKTALGEGSWRGAFALLVYAIFFSFAYLLLTTGTGALILFALVQLTMLGWGFFKGERLSVLQWFGFILAFAGLIYLLSPGLEAPSLLGASLMVIAGLGWGAYSILGKASGNPTRQTAGNFLRASLVVILFSVPVLLFMPEGLPSLKGWLLAIASGALTSGLAYALWYAVLKHLSVTKAGISQLSVPAIAAIGGVLFVSEPLTLRFVLATMIILSGVALATVIKTVRAQP